MARIAPDRGQQSGRKVVAHTFATLDGYMVGPNEDMSWASQVFDREMAEDIREAMSEKAGMFLFGRVTYEIFHSYWPHAVPYADVTTACAAMGDA